VSKDTLNNTGDSRYSRNNNNDSEINAAMVSEGTNDPEAYDDWYSDDEEVDLNHIGGGDDSLDTSAVDAGESGPAAVLSSPEDDGSDDIEESNPDNDELFDEEVDTNNSVIYVGTSSQALNADTSGPAVDSSAQADDSDDIEDFNLDTDELLDEAGEDEGDGMEGSSLNNDDDGGAAQDDNSDNNIEFSTIFFRSILPEYA
jgi:hypothetical protein